jgi:hypothetical protein
MPLTKIQSLGITDGTIVNADINASAAIAGTKLSGVNDAKAWVNFNGTGTVAIRASFNVSSITDGGTGIYTVNFTNALADANFSAVQTTGAGTGTGKLAFGYTATPTTTTYKILTTSFGGTDEDQLYVSVAIFR